MLLATALNPVLGDDKVARITAKALADGSTPREATLGYVTGPEYDRLVAPRAMASRSPDAVVARD